MTFNAQKFKKALGHAQRQHATTASEKPPVHDVLANLEGNTVHGLRVLRDGNAMKMAQRIFTDYISDENFSNYIAFLVKFDQLLVSLGGRPADEEEEMDRRMDDKDKKRDQPKEDKEFS